MSDVVGAVLRSPWFLGVAGTLVAFKFYMKVTTGQCTSDVRLDRKTAVVTGANSGVGLEAALDFAKRGARVVMVCRDMKKAEAAKARIVEETGNSNLSLKHVDFASLASVRDCANQILKEEREIHILLNNAGIASDCFGKTEDGLNTIMQTNHFGPFLFTNILLGRIRESAPSRIANVSSETHKMCNLDLACLDLSNTTSSSTAYGNTKLCNVLVANELSRRLENTGVTVNSLTPGVVLTDILRNAPGWFRVSWNLLTKHFLKNAKEGAQTLIYICVAKELDQVSGKYFKDCQMCATAKMAQDKGVAEKLWELSEKAVGLRPEEKHYAV